MNLNLSKVAGALSLLALTGCASFSPDGGFDRVASLTRERTGIAPLSPRDAKASDAARIRTTELLQHPLTPDAAVEIALLNHRGLRASFAELGIAEADLVRAGRLHNPSLRFGRLAGGGSVEIDRAVIFDVLGLLSMPTASRIERDRFEIAQLQAAADAVGLAAEARRAFFDAVAAQQLLGYAGQVKEAADASGELARRMRAVGNFSGLEQMREQAFEADALAQWLRARHQAVTGRERLARALGLADDLPPFTLPERLPELPAAPVDARNAEQTAMDKRLDLLMARRSAESTAASLGLTKTTRFINVLDVGYQNQSSRSDAGGEPRRNGYEIEFELPLFDAGSTRVARAEATYRQSVDRVAQLALQARSEVRESHSAYLSAYELAKHYRDEVVPLRKRISDEQMLRYNGMLGSVFELLADAREQIAGVTGAVESLRDHWIAETSLQTAIAGRSQP
ncbi:MULTISPECIES: TolC family protein [unclassified Rhizobacter]|uniref:TolC family protein n=1 Tax=unclassified Rhizobacter TaxID=2640088 RepID=UPI0006F6F18D|nr:MULTISPECIES: TolC family protein [unclassified Rhizobacter]KQU69109.1 RND transporter [Rhizobacter sp. Root29]KQW03913.1 RND transporter [Rhizobacter sp. Root1238]KRB21552.1 RND transporter [Rhizobacter sp. Root16D2]